MIRYRVRIGLLALGVLLGYGSAFAQLRGHHGAHGHAQHACFWD